MRDANLCVLTQLDLEDPEIGRATLEIVLSSHEDLKPLRFGNFEPLKYGGEGRVKTDDLMACWGHPFLWSHRKRSRGSIWFGRGKKHSAVVLGFMTSRIDGPKIVQLLEELSIHLFADFASAYIVYESQETWKRRYKAVYPMTVGPFSADLRLSIPDLAWLTYFGRPYVDLIGRSKISTCPAFAATDVKGKGWLIQLTDNPRAARNDPGPYESARDRAKSHLGWEFFLDLGDPEAQRCAPDFSWANLPKVNPSAYLRERGLLKE